MNTLGPSQRQSKFASAQQVAESVADGATLAIVGAGGGLLEPDALLAAIERRFLATGHPRHLTLLHSQGLGDGHEKGLNRLAHEGLVRRVIGAHWAWSPRMQALAAKERIEAYALPGGVIQHLLRESAAGRPGLITHIGLGTFVDPRHGGGRMNARATEPVCELVTIGGRTRIRYLPLKVDLAVLRGSMADAAGNVSFAEEGAELDALVLALAAHNTGGRTVVQVRQEVALCTLPARSVRLPGTLVDALVLVADQMQSYQGVFDPALAGSTPLLPRSAPLETAPVRPASALARRVIGQRAFQELRAGQVVSFGFGIPDEVAACAANATLACMPTVDHGHHGGQSLQGELFGFVRNAQATIDSPTQFDFYSGGGIDIAFLGFGEVDSQGNVNVSKLGGKVIGPGGFIDIAQGSKKIVFCGTFEGQGLQLAYDGGGLHIAAPGRIAKLVKQVEQVTFSGHQARLAGQEVLVVTERAVFSLGPTGLCLQEIAPGMRLQEDVLDRMAFMPSLPAQGPRTMQLQQLTP